MYQRGSPKATGNKEEVVRLWRHLFGHIHGGGLLHIWTGERKDPSDQKLKNPRVANFNYPKAANDAATWAFEKAGEGREVYFCAHLLRHSKRPKRRKDHAAEVRTLWGDLDGTDVPNGDLRPTAVVESSPGHYHCYWRLQTTLGASVAEALNKKLAREIKADPSGFDLTQLLRVPGTRNHKYPDSPLVRVLELDPKRQYEPMDLEGRLSPVGDEEPEGHKSTEAVDPDEPPVRLGAAALKRWRGEVVERGEDGKLDRSFTLVQIARALAHAGATERVIAEALRERDTSLGFDKYVTRRDGGKAYSDLASKVCREAESSQKPPEEPYTPYTPHTPTSKGGGVDFPVDALPKNAARLVSEAAAAIGCPPDGIGLAALATLGTAIGTARVIQLKKGWTEGAAIYASLIAESGEKKTAALGTATDASQKLENRLRKEHEEALETFAREEREYKLEEKQALKDGVVAPPPPTPPVAERAHVNDTTVEALIPILKDNPRGVLLERDELVGWVKAMDQYKAGGKGSDRQFWLSAWSNRPVSVDRKGQQEPIGVLRPFVSVVGSIQPDVLPELAENREDGMLERFLFAYPVALNSMWTEDEISDEALSGYHDLYNNLRRMSVARDDLGDPIETPLVFSPEAKELFVSQYDVHRTEMGMPGFPKSLRSPWAKLEGYFARLTLILACCRGTQERAPERIEVEDVLRAWTLIGYFKAQARRVFGILRGFDWEEKLTEDVAWFLHEHGGKWTGQPHDFHEALPSDHKHERADDLSKWLKGRPEFDHRSGQKAAKKDDGSPTTVRVLALTL